jgi:hypothetical protein
LLFFAGILFSGKWHEKIDMSAPAVAGLPKNAAEKTDPRFFPIQHFWSASQRIFLKGVGEKNGS